MSYMDYRSDIAEKVGYDEFPDTTEGIIDLMKKSQDEILNETGKQQVFREILRYLSKEGF